MKYLRPKQEYIDRYDRITVDDCRRRENFHKNYEPSQELKAKAPSSNFHKAVINITLHYDLLFTTLRWYDNKESTIQEWMDKDQRRDDLMASARPPENIRCLTCYSLTSAGDRIVFDVDGTDRLLFLFDCPKKCMPHRAFYENGEEHRTKPRLCSKCQESVTETHERKEDEKVVTTITCGKCGNVETDELDLSPKQEEPDPDYEKDRAHFCLTEETAKKPREEKWQLEGMKKLVEEWEEKKKHKADYEAVGKVPKLTVIELEKLLVPLVEAAGYVKFQFGAPEMGRDLFVPFSLHDAKQGRADRDSSHTLQKLIKKALAETNWRLMTDGISYRLGILTGRLRAYEREEDLLALVRSNEKHEKET